MLHDFARNGIANYKEIERERERNKRRLIGRLYRSLM